MAPAGSDVPRLGRRRSADRLSAKTLRADRQEGGAPGAVHGGLVAAYYCALDKGRPCRAKAILLAALGYFVLPADTIPEYIVCGLGVTDDVAVLAAAIAAVRAHMNARPPACRKARRWPGSAERSARPTTAAGRCGRAEKTNSCRFPRSSSSHPMGLVPASAEARSEGRRSRMATYPILKGDLPLVTQINSR